MSIWKRRSLQDVTLIGYEDLSLSDVDIKKRLEKEAEDRFYKIVFDTYLNQEE